MESGWQRVFFAVACLQALANSASGDAAETIHSRAAASVSGASLAVDRIGSIATGLIAQRASADAQYLGAWIEARGDHGDLPFAIIDKRQARLYVFDNRQTLIGTSTILTGASPGDKSAPGVGARAQTASLRRAERTTPAGRFESQPGTNLTGEDIVWFDYQAALAIHRLRPDATFAERSRRLASATPTDNRISLGCVVVPVAFYERIVQPWLGARRGVVYVLPEHRTVQAVWPSNAPVLALVD